MNTPGIVQVSLQKQKTEKKREKKSTKPTQSTKPTETLVFTKGVAAAAFVKEKNQQSFRRSDSLCCLDSHPRAFFPQWPQKFLVPFAKMLDFFFF